MFVDYGNKYLYKVPEWKRAREKQPTRAPKEARPRTTKRTYLTPHGPGYNPTRGAPRPMERYELPPSARGFTPRAGPLARGATRGLIWAGAQWAVKINPYVRGLSYAWDIANAFSDEWYTEQNGGLTYDLAASGWTQCCSDPGVKYEKVRAVGGPTYASGNPAPAVCTVIQSNCGLGLQVPSGDYGDPIVFNVPTGVGQYYETIFFGESAVSGTRLNLQEKWQRIVPRGGGVQTINAVAAPSYVVPLPVDPFEPFPEWPTVAEPSAQEAPALAPPRLPPYAVAGVQFAPGEKPRAIVHRKLRPGRREREKKGLVIKRGRLAKYAGGVFGAVTEGLDFVNALWKALPKDKRTRGASQKQKVLDVWNNWKHIDIEEATLNVVENQISDRVIGQLNKKVISPFVKNGPAAKYWVRPTAPGAGARRWSVPIGL